MLSSAFFFFLWNLSAESQYAKKWNFSFLPLLILCQPFCISAGFPHVEKGCGKICGDCGKVIVFNSYSVFFQSAHLSAPPLKLLYTRRIFNNQANYVTAGNWNIFPKLSSKSWKIPKLSPAALSIFRLDPKIFGDIPQHAALYDLAPVGNTVDTQLFRRFSCREK